MSQKNVLVVSLRSPFLDSDRVYAPLGPLYLSGALKAAGHHVDLEDAFGQEGEQRVTDYRKYDIVGVSILTPQKQLATEVLRTLKGEQSSQVLVAGGPHATFYTDEVETQGWDHIVRGYGERSIVRIANGDKLPRVLEDSIEPEDYDEFPRPDRLGNRDFLSHYHHTFGGEGKSATNFIAGRGCPMECTFCEGAKTPVLWTSEEKTVAELDDIQELGHNAVYVIDDTFTLSPNTVRPYAEELSRRELPYKCNAHAKFMSPRLADLLAETGCVEVGFGSESGSQKILDMVKKGTTVEQNYEFIRMMKERGIRVKTFLMLGLPGETRDTIRETEEFIQKSGIHDFQLTVYAPYRGTQIRKALDEGSEDLDLFLEGEPSAHTQKQGKGESKVRTAALTSQEILEHRDRLIQTYRPASHTASRKDVSFSETVLKR